MAKANDKSSTIDRIWLHDALALAVAAFGSAVLAKMRLTGMAGGREAAMVLHVVEGAE